MEGVRKVEVERSEIHEQINISTDASGYKYEAVVCFHGGKVEIGDFLGHKRQ